ncbi:hypothetical protein LRS10_16280 [Phenylobacterium sp. J426]|uniref:hypothetical protein n=1 Tax=Phenylobacterium sp. J426 TaxID=2898439 RepID=UPI00215072D2|nr:hypothetical protein [Phenylobacterium sp. J426]MCR5875595.1 hypothetical protein [Phenylobacterium sp. J426]
MRDLKDIIEQFDRFSTVLIASKTPENSEGVVEILLEAGINVVGPVSRAKHALTLAAHSPIDLALVTDELAGERNGAELARSLADTWGVRTIPLPAA